MPFGGRAPCVVSQDSNGSDIRPELTGGKFHEGGLAGAIGADQPGDAGAQFQSHLVDADHRAIPFGDMVEMEQGRFGA